MENVINSLVSYIQTSHVTGLVFLLAFVGGVISSLSPCSLGVLPLVLAYIGGSKDTNTKRILVQLLAFSIGLSIVLSVVGVACALTGKAFTSVSSPLWIIFLASLIMVFGLNLLGLVEIPFPTIIKKFPQGDSESLFLYPALIGMAFALATTPCSSPILATIMAIASLSAKISYSILLLFLFAIGQCVIIVICGLFASVIKNLKSMAPFTEMLMKLSGVVFILLSLFIFYKVFQPFV